MDGCWYKLTFQLVRTSVLFLLYLRRINTPCSSVGPGRKCRNPIARYARTGHPRVPCIGSCHDATPYACEQLHPYSFVLWRFKYASRLLGELLFSCHQHLALSSFVRLSASHPR